jgi:membrane-bound lytic murein transglycosylase F
MSKIYFLVSVFVVIFFAQCDTPQPFLEAQDEVIPTQVETHGKLVALIDNNISSYYIYKGQPRGFEYDLLKWFCQDHDLQLELKIVPHFDFILDSLKSGIGDVAAANLTITKERLGRVRFTPYLTKTRQVIVQRLPAHHYRLSKRELNSYLINDVLELDGKVVHVHKESAFYKRLSNIANENGLDIQIAEVDPDIDTDLLVKMVADELIDYTILDENIARLQAGLYKNLHVETPVSLTQAISWAVRKDSDSLHLLLSNWIEEKRDSRKFNAIYRKYFHPTKATLADIQSNFNLQSGGKISEFDAYFKTHAASISVDWRLLAALAYHESRFNPDATSPFGAAGLMQVVPNTAARFGVEEEEIFNPERNVAAAVGFLGYLYKYWRKKLEDHSDVDKFVLASYNAGLGHIIDARNLAASFNLDTDQWHGNVEQMLLNKSNATYYNHPVVKNGYCRGSEPVNYVNRVLGYYNQYVMLTGEDS